ncbi:hypothetical protein GQ600_11206 [Phytophthora cactorum]|nr:hypothetical protein GQ600_11206 [Phytophthora cactorum]
MHRPSQHGRPSRTSTLTTHNETSDSEADLDSSFNRRDTDSDKFNTVDTTPSVSRYWTICCFINKLRKRH